MSEHRRPRDSDRWVTPRVVVAGIFAVTVMVLAVIGVVGYLSAIGVDPDPMVRLSAQVATGVGSLGALLLQLANRSTVTKIERNTGTTLPAKVEDLGGQLEQALWVDETHTKSLPPVPPPIRDTERHPFSRA